MKVCGGAALKISETKISTFLLDAQRFTCIFDIADIRGISLVFPSSGFCDRG